MDTRPAINDCGFTEKLLLKIQHKTTRSTVHGYGIDGEYYTWKDKRVHPVLWTYAKPEE